jgi:hypothetical protein
LGSKILEVDIDKDEVLSVFFEDGAKLLAFPHPNFESWVLHYLKHCYPCSPTGSVKYTH